MTTKRDLIIAVLLTFCLAATLFTIIPTHSQVNPYDPWCDLNDDGVIDISDVVMATSRYRSIGDPAKNVTVTNWPVASGVMVWWGP